MSKKLYVVVAVLVMATMLFAACTPKTTEAPEAKLKICQVTDTRSEEHTSELQSH